MTTEQEIFEKYKSKGQNDLYSFAANHSKKENELAKQGYIQTMEDLEEAIHEAYKAGRESREQVIRNLADQRDESSRATAEACVEKIVAAQKGWEPEPNTEEDAGKAFREGYWEGLDMARSLIEAKFAGKQ